MAMASDINDTPPILREADDNARDWPAAPMRRDTGDEHAGASWTRPQQQPARVEILKSVERPGLTATFGTPEPPSGLSGVIRRFAFEFSESNGLHWISLMLADRIDMVEGVAADLGRGHVPNLFEEMGLTADPKYNRKGLAIKTGLAAAAVIGLCLCLRRRKGSIPNAQR